jgi:NAD(P)H-nitrite reductase large subunit
MRDEMVCYCKRVTEGTIVQAIRAGARTLAAIRRATGACTGNRCKELNPKGRCCAPEIQALIDRECGGTTPSGCCCGGG